MNQFFYPKLAFSNIKKNQGIYFPYFLTCVFTIVLFYSIRTYQIEILQKVGMSQSEANDSQSNSNCIFPTAIDGNCAYCFCISDCDETFICIKLNKCTTVFNLYDCQCNDFWTNLHYCIFLNRGKRITKLFARVYEER